MRSCALTLVFVAIAFSATPAYATPDMVTPTLPGSFTFECIDCHVHPGGGTECDPSVHPIAPCLNPFGRTYWGSGWSNALRDADRDGDGLSNGTELSTDPNSAGLPTGAESVGCSMLAAASTPGTAVQCGTSNVYITATYSSASVNNYALTYTCLNGTFPVPSTTDTDWSDRCLDRADCTGNPCDPGACTEQPLGGGWTEPGYDCSCPSGYVDTGTICLVVNLCTAGADNCNGLATCEPVGTTGFTCACPPGYTGDGMLGGTGCVDTAECDATPCGARGSGGADGVGCTETPIGSWSSPGYTCECQTGFESNGTTCVLADECTAGTDDCHSAAVCNDPSMVSGDYTCTCATGYVGTGHGSLGCRDIDECAVGMDDCDTNASCANTPGGFVCTCNSGFEGSGSTCTDYDECGDPIFSSMCDLNATCNNLFSTFECVCNAGYAGDGFSPCSDVDECAAGTDDCVEGADCTNTVGGWTCACGDGWTGDGDTCTDIDECLSPALSGRCSSVAVCDNRPGTWGCLCNEGFDGDGFVCEDVDECALGTHTCHRSAACTNTTGEFSCECVAGYRGSGFDCSDVDECAEGTDGCGPSERCINQIGATNLCLCRAGFVRNDADECVRACGDGSVAPGESCDDGNNDDGDGCDSFCTTEMGWACYEPTGAASTCTQTCGDAFVDPSEECDDGDANADAPDVCRTNCALPACNDGILDTGEECDGPDNSDTVADACRTTCVPAYCGDGVVDMGETCDPGGLMPGMASVRACTTDCPMMDAGTMPDPPMEGGCAIGPGSRSGAPWALGVLALALLGLRRRRR